MGHGRWRAACFLLALAGCASAGLSPPGAGDGASDGQNDLGGDGGGADLKPATDGGCALGTADHCGGCGVTCPPGGDDGGSLRSCSPTATCGFLCRGEFYDVDGDPANGCEALDATIQDSALTAVGITLPDVVNDPTFKSNPLNTAEKIYGDARSHETLPTLRPNGRDDWFKVTAVGLGDPQSGMTACLGITNFPADNLYQICIGDSGQATFTSGGCATTRGGQASVCVLPPAATDAGTYYVRIHKMSGAQTALFYALFLKH